jgi:hypothetical protein
MASPQAGKYHSPGMMLVVANEPNMDYTMFMSLSQDLKDAIEKDSRSLGRLAEDAGTNKAILSLFTRGIRTITLPTAERILAALGLKIKLVRDGKKDERRRSDGKA